MASADTLAIFDALAARPDSASSARLAVRNGHVVLAFEDSSESSIDWFGVFPSAYSGGSIQMELTWAAEQGGVGDVKWAAALERLEVGGTTDLDIDNFTADVIQTDAAPASSGQLVSTLVVLASSAAAGEAFRLRVKRLGADPADTLSGDAQVLHLMLKEV